MSHEHHDCKHEVKYCEKCNVCYCVKCGEEWTAKWKIDYWPKTLYEWTTTGTIPAYKDTSHSH